MYKSKLIQLLKTFTKEEVKEFDRFVRSPFFNREQRCVQLWEQVRRFYPNFTATQLEKHHLMALVFPKKSCSLASFRALISQLTKLIEQFLVVMQRKQEDSVEQWQIDLLKSLHIRQQEKLFIATAKQLEKKLAVQQQDAQYFNHYGTFKEQLLAFKMRYPKFSLPTSHHVVLEHFRTYSTIVELSYCCSILNRATFKKSRLIKDDFMAYYQYISNKKELLHIPIVQCYYSLFKMLLYVEEEQYFQQTKQQLANTLLHKKDQNAIYTTLLNYCTQKIIAGQATYYQEMFALYQIMLSQHLLERDNCINIRYVKNIASLGLKLKRFDWTKSFITDYKTKVLPQYQDSVFHFNMGAWHFYQQQYKEALTHFMQVNYIDAFYHCDCKSLLLKCYYELKETEAFLSLIDAFKMYLKREKSLSADRKKAYHHFMRFTLRLYKIKALYSNKSVAKLVGDVNKEEVVSDRGWLLEKAKELDAK